MTTSPSSRVHTDMTQRVTISRLSSDVIHLIEERHSVADITTMVCRVYGSGKRVKIPFTLRDKTRIEIILSTFDPSNANSVPYTGTIVNGGQFQKVEGVFTGTAGGSLRLVD